MAKFKTNPDLVMLQTIQDTTYTVGKELISSQSRNLAEMRTGLAFWGKAMVALRLKIVHTSTQKLPSPDSVETLSPKTGKLSS
jgi:hypothetical protein